MKALRLPDWLRPMVERSREGSSCVFLLQGNVRDLQPFGERHRPLEEGLSLLLDRRTIVVRYDIASGFTFPDKQRETAFRKALGLKSGPIPADPARAVLLLDTLLRSERALPGSLGLVLDSLHHIAPVGASGSAERQTVATLARWASDRQVAARRPVIVMIAPSIGEVNDEIHSGAAALDLLSAPRPDLESRRAFLAERLASLPLSGGAASAATAPGAATQPVASLSVDQLASETGGLSLAQIEDVLERGRSGESLSREAVVSRKLELLRQEYGDVLEIVTPKHGLDAVGGLEHATRELSEIAALMQAGQTSAAPMGIVLMGPPGTGKSYLAECFAKECGLLCVRFRPLRQMYVGQSERNQERAFAAIRALAPVVVIVDESDQAEGGSRDAGGGDSGVAERMRAGAFNFWGDGTLRGKVLRIDITNRIDLIDTAMKRSGRSDVKIPILMPDAEARRQILEVTVRKHKLASEVSDWPKFAKATDGYTGSDLELLLTTAWRFALRSGSTALRDENVQAALDDLMPLSRDQAAIDRMTLLALDECRNRRLLPRNHEAIRAAIEARRG